MVQILPLSAHAGEYCPIEGRDLRGRGMSHAAPVRCFLSLTALNEKWCYIFLFLLSQLFPPLLLPPPSHPPTPLVCHCIPDIINKEIINWTYIGPISSKIYCSRHFIRKQRITVAYPRQFSFPRNLSSSFVSQARTVITLRQSHCSCIWR